MEPRTTTASARTEPPSLIHIRTPTYRRGEALTRCLQSLQAQSWANWICDVFDDDPEGSAAAVVKALGDDRIRHHQNRPQRFASKNIDACFSRENPHDADFFCVVEDDNHILPDFITANVALCGSEGVEVVLRNQLVEYASGTPNERLSTFGILDSKFVEGRYDANLLRLALMAGIGISNGGLFWSRHARSNFEIGFSASATLHEYARTYALKDDIYVAMDPLAVWADNGTETTRNIGAKAGSYRRELNLKRSIVELQRRSWAGADARERSEFLHSPAFAHAEAARARGLVKSLTAFDVEGALSTKEWFRLILRGCLIRLAGRIEPGLKQFIEASGA
ncbi:MAG: glycosyltransferase family A protein [Paracoccaceae bacterium]